MKRYHNIDPLFNQARRLPLEVNIEQVQGFLATSALPAGASKSWFNSFNFYLMTGLITGSIALYIALSGGINASPEVAATNASSPLDEQTVFAGIIPSNEATTQSRIVENEAVPFDEDDRTDQKEAEKPIKDAPANLALESAENSRHEEPLTDDLLGENSFLAYSAPDWEDHYFQSPHDEAGSLPDAISASREIRFLISAEDLTDQVRGTLGKAREYNLRVSEIKQKRKRNGHLKHLKVAFAIPHENPSCGWKTFRTVDLKGFKTYEYGWTLDADGNITDFWDKLNNKEPSEIATPSKVCGQIKYVCKSS